MQMLGVSGERTKTMQHSLLCASLCHLCSFLHSACTPLLTLTAVISNLQHMKQ